MIDFMGMAPCADVHFAWPFLKRVAIYVSKRFNYFFIISLELSMPQSFAFPVNFFGHEFLRFKFIVFF